MVRRLAIIPSRQRLTKGKHGYFAHRYCRHLAVAADFEAGADMGDSDSTPGREPEVGHLRSVVGLVWRSVVVWMLLLALLTLARLLG